MVIATLSAPVLSVAADVVKDLEGGDALCGLWALFTKCKESLQDGQRLENISWRMWYREMVAAQSYRPPTPETSPPPLSDSSKDFPFFPRAEKTSIRRDAPLRPIDERHTTTSFTDNHHQHDHSSEKLPTPAPSMPSPCPSSCLSISFGRPKSNPSVGQFIVDILPHAISPVRPTTAARRAISDPSNNFRGNVHPASPLPAVCLPTSTDPVFPRVVVVNPTPHPTPPATPILQNISTAAQIPSEHLLPPLPSPLLMTVPMTQREITPLEAKDLSPPPVPRLSKPVISADETLNASDPRFFLHYSPEGQSPECDGSTDGGKATSSDVVEVSSGGSSHAQHKGIAGSDRPVTTKSTRKGKEIVRHVGMSRPNCRRGQIVRPGVKRQTSGDAAKHRPTFNIGSSSSNGSKDAQNGDGSSSSKVTPPLPPVPPAPLRETALKRAPSPVKTTQMQGRRIVVASSASSEYETDSDDDSWCSEEMSVEDNAKTKEDIRLREAALEAQRQRDLFAKVPKRSYSNLDRSKSGLLTTLLNPDPNIFPPNHPYRISASSQDIPRRPGFAPMTPLTTSKGSAAMPQASQATVQVPGASGANHQPKTKAGGGYHPKGRPQGQEMEDESDSDEDNPDDRIQVSRSVAQERLAALAGRRGIERSQSSRPSQPAVTRPILPTVTSAPIPFGHPYNLPAPAPPSTPRTTRRQMLSTELSESLRRNLLWERQVSKNALVGQRRQSATALSDVLRPLTSTTTAGESSKHGGPNANPSTSHQRRDEKAEKDDRKRLAMARNRSWADDYHYSGW